MQITDFEVLWHYERFLSHFDTNWLLKRIRLRPSLSEIVVFQAHPWRDACSYDASWVRSGALGTALCGCVGEMFIAAKSQKPQALFSEKLTPLFKFLQAHFTLSLMGIQRSPCQMRIRKTPQSTGVILTAQLLRGRWWDILLSLHFFFCLALFSCLHSECNEAQLFMEINGFHRDEDSALYIKEHMPNQALWVGFSEAVRELYYWLPGG